VTSSLRTLAIAGLVSSWFGLSLAAQTPAAPAPTSQGSTSEPASPRQDPVQLQVVIGRSRDGRRISNKPYSLSAKMGRDTQPNERGASLRIGAQLPLPNNPAVAADGSRQASGYIFRTIGTNIDAAVFPRDNDRFAVTLWVSESSVYSELQQPAQLKPGDAPVLRSYESTNTLMLRDGQTGHFAAGTDPISGDLVTVDVTLNLLK